MKFCVFDNYVEKKMKAEIKELETRVMTEIKQTQKDVKEVSINIGEIKGSLDTLIGLTVDRKN